MQKEIDKEKPIADAEAEKTSALETGAFFDTEKPTPKKKAGEKKKNA